MVLVSVVVPAYNASVHLSDCLDSLLAQSERSLQIIVVNDGSTDDTSLLAERYSTDDPRLTVINQVNGGVSSARNAGLAAAVGKYVCFVDSDDWVEPSMVESMVSWCESTSADVVIAGAFVDFHDERESLVRSETRMVRRSDIHQGKQLPVGMVDEKLINLLGYPWNKMYRRDWLIGLDEWFEPRLHLFEDLDFNSRVLPQARHIALVPEAFVHYVQRPKHSLGAFRGDNLFALHKRALEGVDSLLWQWGVDEDVRRARKVRASAMALWSGLVAAAESPNSHQNLVRLVESPGATDLISLSISGGTVGWRGRWAGLTLRRGWYRIALLPVRLRQILREVLPLRR